jgi:prepilin-type N-terminal cleavage/methylation domain-containing protein
MPLPFQLPRRPASRGFTLIELLTVIAIIGILASILVPAIGAVKRMANKTRTKVLFGQLQSAFINYRNTYNIYPIFPELGAIKHAAAGQPNEIDYNFLLNGGGGILYKVLYAPGAYNSSAAAKSANYNQQGIQFLELDDNAITRDDPASDANPFIMDGFRNTQIGVVIHSGNQKTIAPQAFGVAVEDVEQTGSMIPTVVRPINDIFAFYSLIEDINGDPLNSNWITSWEYDDYKR